MVEQNKLDEMSSKIEAAKQSLMGATASESVETCELQATSAPSTNNIHLISPAIQTKEYLSIPCGAEQHDVTAEFRKSGIEFELEDGNYTKYGYGSISLRIDCKYENDVKEIYRHLKVPYDGKIITNELEATKKSTEDITEYARKASQQTDSIDNTVRAATKAQEMDIEISNQQETNIPIKSNKSTRNYLQIISEIGQEKIRDFFKKEKINWFFDYGSQCLYVDDQKTDIVKKYCDDRGMFYSDHPSSSPNFIEFKIQETIESIGSFEDDIAKTASFLGLTYKCPFDLFREECVKNPSTDTEKKLKKLLSDHDKLLANKLRFENERKMETAKTTEFLGLIEILPYTFENLETDLLKTKEGLLTGYPSLDELIRIPNEAITLVGGRPSHGKTTLMMNLLINMIKKYPDLKFYFFSYEETRQQIAVKIINILSGYTFHPTQNLNYIQGYIKNKKNDNPALETGKETYNNFITSSRLNIIGERYHVKKLQEMIAKIKSQGLVGAVFIDYIQKIKNDKFGTRQQELQNTSELLLDTAIKQSVPIILGAQLGRDPASKDKVRLENLRECGDLEQDAKVVLGLFNPAMEKSQDNGSQVKEQKIDITVTPLKNRDGITNVDVNLKFERPILTITD